MFYLICVNFKCNIVKGFVGGGMVVVVNDGYVGLCNIEFWLDDVYNVLIGVF